MKICFKALRYSDENDEENLSVVHVGVGDLDSLQSLHLILWNWLKRDPLFSWFLDVMNLHVVDVVVAVDGVSVLHRDLVYWKKFKKKFIGVRPPAHNCRYSSYVRWWKYLLNRK